MTYPYVCYTLITFYYGKVPVIWFIKINNIDDEYVFIRRQVKTKYEIKIRGATDLLVHQL